MAHVILIPGTHGNLGDISGRWWAPGSAIWSMLIEAGHRVASFPWDTCVDGLLGENTRWIKAGRRLQATMPAGASVIAHSHGGAVVAYAAAHGARFGTVITLGTPPRSDVPYRALPKNSNFWAHLYGDWRDFWAVLGAAGDGEFNWWRRSMRYADRNILCEANHTDLCTAKVLREAGVLDILEGQHD